MFHILKGTHSLLRFPSRKLFRSFTYPIFRPFVNQRRVLSVFSDVKLPNNLSSDITSLSADKKRLTISWKADSNKSEQYYSIWLRHQCNCEECFQSASGQNLVDPDSLDPPILLGEVSVQDECVHITWIYEDGSVHKGFISLHWLYQMRQLPAKRPDVKFSLPELEFEDILSTEEGLHNYLSLMNQHGVVNVVNAPGETAVVQFAERISYREPTFFESVWDLLVVDDPINAAYSDMPLKHHTDLPFCYNQVGLQHLHCIRNDPCVEGGILTLNDIYEVAKKFRQEYPDFFQTLSRVPVIFHHITFSKQTYMEVRCPIFSLDQNGEITYIRWGPHTLGPVIETNDDSTLDAFFTAYAQFLRYVESYPPKVAFKYRPGDITSFHNLRMVHGRSKIQLNGGVRYLKGCYTPIDEFLSRLRYLSIKLGKPLSSPAVLF